MIGDQTDAREPSSGLHVTLATPSEWREIATRMGNLMPSPELTIALPATAFADDSPEDCLVWNEGTGWFFLLKIADPVLTEQIRAWRDQYGLPAPRYLTHITLWKGSSREDYELLRDTLGLALSPNVELVVGGLAILTEPFDLNLTSAELG